MAALSELRLTRADVEAAIAPYVQERLAADDPRWLKLMEKRRRRERERLVAAGPEVSARNQTEVETAYSKRWLRPLSELLTSKVIPFEWHGQGLLMQSLARRHLNHLLLARALDAVGARRVLEVGMGTGFHLFLLAVKRPELELTGVEISAGGIAAARGIRAAAVLPSEIARFAPGEALAVGHARVRIVRASAPALPFVDGCVDAAVTVLALEQMEALRDRALAELRRVTSRWVIMIEPFRDLNTDGAASDYVTSHGYFSETIDGLRRHGLVPRIVYHDVPNKLALRVGLVVAERQ